MERLETCSWTPSSMHFLDSFGAQHALAELATQGQLIQSGITSLFVRLLAWSVYFNLFMFLLPFATKVHVCTAMTMDNQMLPTLTRLQLNLYEDLAG